VAYWMDTSSLSRPWRPVWK